LTTKGRKPSLLVQLLVKGGGETHVELGPIQGNEKNTKRNGQIVRQLVQNWRTPIDRIKSSNDTRQTIQAANLRCPGNRQLSDCNI